MHLLRLALLIVALVSTAPSFAQDAGRVESLTGTAEAVGPDQTVRPLAVGATFAQGDRIRVARNSQVRLRFGDGSQMDLAANSNMILEQYVVSPEAEQNAFTARVLLGAFRFVSGVIARRNPQATRVAVPVATIGIRGTHFGGEVEETSARISLLEPDDKQPTAIEVFNDFGRVVIDRPGYGTEIPDANSPPSPVRQMQLRQIQTILRAIRVAPPAPAPAPAAAAAVTQAPLQPSMPAALCRGCRTATA